ncbi:hypothetical protein KCU93_g507, partial [Aureobasidium melanogenum]
MCNYSKIPFCQTCILCKSSQTYDSFFSTEPISRLLLKAIHSHAFDMRVTTALRIINDVGPCLDYYIIYISHQINLTLLALDVEAANMPLALKPSTLAIELLILFPASTCTRLFLPRMCLAPLKLSLLTSLLKRSSLLFSLSSSEEAEVFNLCLRPLMPDALTPVSVIRTGDGDLEAKLPELLRLSLSAHLRRAASRLLLVVRSTLLGGGVGEASPGRTQVRWCRGSSISRAYSAYCAAALASELSRESELLVSVVVQLSVVFAGGSVGLLLLVPRTGDGVMARGRPGGKMCGPDTKRRGLRAGGSRSDEEVSSMFEERRDDAKRTGLMTPLLARLRINDCRFSARGRRSMTLSVWLTRRMLRRFSASVKERRFSVPAGSMELINAEFLREYAEKVLLNRLFLFGRCITL